MSGVTVRRAGPVLRVLLDDPATRNALSVAKLAALRDAVESVWADESVRVIVLAGSGGVFSSGWDFKAGAVADHSVGERALLEAYAAIANCRVPVIGLVEGAVFGAAVGLVGSCDIAVAAENAVFCLPETRFGGVAFPAMVPCLARWRVADAARYLLTGERFSGADAAVSGLVSVAVPPEDVVATVEQIVAGVVAGEASSVATTKRILRRLTAGVDVPVPHVARWANSDFNYAYDSTTIPIAVPVNEESAR